MTSHIASVYIRTVNRAGSMPNIRHLAIGAGLTLASTTGAHADWRYCLAASDAAKKVYFSDPFSSDAPLRTLEASFGQMLMQSEIGHTQVQCPRAASEREIVEMRNEAISFNKDFFSRGAVELHWTLNASVEVNSGG